MYQDWVSFRVRIKIVLSSIQCIKMGEVLNISSGTNNVNPSQKQVR